MNIAKRLLSVSLAAAAAFSLSVTSLAWSSNRFKKYDDIVTPGQINCEINVKGESITVTSNQKGPQKFTTKDGRIAFRVDKQGLVLSFTTKGNNFKEVRLGEAYIFDVTGEMSSLSLHDSLSYRYKAEVDATVNELTVTGECEVELSENSSVNELAVYNKDAKVMALDGAFIHNSLNEPASELRLDVDIRDYRSYTAHSDYDINTKILTLRATTPGCTVQEALKDAIIRVERKKDGEAVSGRWVWLKLDGGSTESGSYTCHFFPSDNRYQSLDLNINFVANSSPQK